MAKTIVAALGGNAILQSKDKGTYQNQLKNIKKSSRFLAKLVERGYKLVLTHGNGPQIGQILQQNEEAKDIVPPMPLDVLNGMSQGFIGYMIVQCLENELKRLGLNIPIVNLLTRVEVSSNDTDFGNPSKPIGMFYEKNEVSKLSTERNWHMKQDANRGWRRVVPSPQPVKILEAETIKQITESGKIVVANGGGGIPVIRNQKGEYEGIEAVIDKDRSGCKLAEEVEADIFMILTDIEHVFINFGTPYQQKLETISVSDMEKYLQEGQFSQGSMAPKVEAALTFAEKTGTSIICSLERIEKSIRGESGTIISNEPGSLSLSNIL